MKNWKKWTSGLFAVVLLASLACGAVAAGGKLKAAEAGIVLLDQVRTEPGAEFTAGSANIPAVVCYEDASGKAHHYLPVEMLPELLNVDVSWSESRKSVVLGPTIEGVSYSEDDLKNALSSENPTSPVKGAVAGPFTEVDPKLVDTSEKPVLIAEDDTKVQTVTGFSTGGYFNPERGKYIVLKIQNNGTTKITSVVGREMTLGGAERFRSVDIEPGKTLTRAFRIADGVDELHGTFLCGARPSFGGGTANVTISLKQYK